MASYKGTKSAHSTAASLGLVIGTDVQAWDNDLDDIAALTPTLDNVMVGNGTDWILAPPATLAGIVEPTLDARYVEVTGDTMTGTLEVDGSASGKKLILRANASQIPNLFESYNAAGTKRASITKDAEFSCPNGLTAEQFGAGATATGYAAAAFGNGAIANNTFAVAFGSLAQATAFNTLALGFNAIASGSYATSLGAACQATGNNTFAMGTGASASHTGSMAIGAATSTANYQLLFGNAITDVYFGQGVVHATPQAITINPTSGSGTNIAGADISFQGGRGTGTGIGGDLIFKTAPPGTTGTALNALVERLRITDNGIVQVAEAVDVTLGTTTGTKIGTATSQKLGFFNATPAVQPSSTGETTGFTLGSGGTNMKEVSTFTGGIGTTAYRLNDIVKHLKTLGLIAQ